LDFSPSKMSFAVRAAAPPKTAAVARPRRGDVMVTRAKPEAAAAAAAAAFVFAMVMHVLPQPCPAHAQFFSHNYKFCVLQSQLRARIGKVWLHVPPCISQAPAPVFAINESLTYEQELMRAIEARGAAPLPELTAAPAVSAEVRAICLRCVRRAVLSTQQRRSCSGVIVNATHTHAVMLLFVALQAVAPKAPASATATMSSDEKTAAIRAQALRSASEATAVTAASRGAYPISV
jgi:hypothetical protein